MSSLMGTSQFQNNQEYLNNEYEGVDFLENVTVADKTGSLKPITDIWWAIVEDVGNLCLVTAEKEEPLSK